MIYVRKTFQYLDENETEKEIEFKGTIKLKTIAKIQSDLKDSGREITVPEIINGLGELDIQIISLILTTAIQEGSNQDIAIIMQFFEFNEALDFTLKLLTKTMPGKQQNESMFSDEEEFELEYNKQQDWDFDYMMFLWHGAMNRNDDFWELTPKQFFKQLEIQEKVNNTQNNEIVEEV